ncbi:DUF6509 family protein [Fervidibacillus halotolerans]|uniref:DUF6509 family protein n=1 Tax=Fervidibacillus halotolerans TaxID=2980027 RepID=A0A9E8RZF9_9BACI|nr:DUF6509 family protein [Fervidibacillus halotolerans]WAA13109.1 DUF6509 family protein [Fervidibacillus halotolerans]
MDKVKIIEYEMEKLNDPTGILAGDRFEFLLVVQVCEDDELYSENGLYIKLIYSWEENFGRIAQYQIFEKVTDKYLPYSLEEDELEAIRQFCKRAIGNESV